MSDNIITLSRDDTAAFMAAVADIEDFTLGLPECEELDEPVKELSRIASIIGGQVDAQ